MSLASGQNYIVCRSFGDCDDYAEILAGYQWDMDIEQLGRGELKADLVSLLMGPFLINHLKVNHSMLVRGQTPGQISILGLPVDMESNGSWMGKPLGLETIQCYARGREFEVVTPVSYETVTCGIVLNNYESVSDYKDYAGSAYIPDIFASNYCGRIMKRRLVSKCFQLLNQFQQNPGYLEQQSCISDCSEEIFALLGQIDPSNNDSNNASRRKTKAVIVARAIEYLDSRKGESISVQELRQHALASRSTLERAFREQFGIMPKAYLMARRLNGVRKMLRTSDPGTCNISEVAIKWGFWHMSQFAADYRRQFGELPSESFSRSRHSAR